MEAEAHRWTTSCVDGGIPAFFYPWLYIFLPPPPFSLNAKRRKEGYFYLCLALMVFCLLHLRTQFQNSSSWCSNIWRENRGTGFYISSVFQFDFSVLLSQQMPQVLHRGSQGIDLHFWGQVLSTASDKIQIVRTPAALQSESCRTWFYVCSCAGSVFFCCCRFEVTERAPSHDCRRTAEQQCRRWRHGFLKTRIWWTLVTGKVEEMQKTDVVSLTDWE